MRQRIGLLPSITIALASVLTTAMGCGAHPDARQGRQIQTPTPPPTYPESHDVPIDAQLQQRAEAELLQDLHDNDASVRAHAIEGLQAATGAKHGQELADALNDKDPLVRYAACLAVGTARVDSAKGTLTRLVDDPDSGVRVTARYALHRLGVFTYSHDLERMTHDLEPRVRGTTAMVLGMIGDKSAVPLLLHMRKDTHPAVRQQASISLWRLGSDQGLSDLVGWTMSHFEDDEKVALLGLAETHNRSVIQHIRAHLTDDAPDVALVASRAMGMLGCDEGLGVINRHIGSQDPRERVLAALALAAIGRSDTQSSLRTLASDAQADVRIAASQAILQLKPHFVDECNRN